MIPSFCFEACTQEVTDPLTECQDDNKDNGDGCDSECQVEEGFLCDETGCHVACGDGQVNNGEQCDDGGTENGDGCNSSCELMMGWQCEEVEGLSHCTERCGDGL